MSNPASQTLTITDDDAQVLTLALSPASITENGGVSTVTATLSTAATAAVTITVSASAVSPAVAGDFSLSTNTTLTIASGQKTSTGEVTVTAVNNSVDAPNKTVTVSGAASGGGVSSPADQTLTITDDEATPTVTLVLSPASITEDGGESTVTATLSGASSAAVSVTVSASAVSPATSSDFNLSTNKTLSIAAGATTSTGEVTITAVNNEVDTDNKTVTVSGAASGGNGVSDPSNQTLTITDDDAQVLTLVLSPSSISENGGVSTVTATLSTAATAAVTITVSASAVSPAVAGDFELSTNKRLTIASGANASTGTVTITAVDNEVDTDSKTVTVSGAASGGGVSNPASQTLTITDDDAQVLTLALSPASITENGGVSTVTATLSTAATAAVTITVSASAVSPAVAGDFSLSTNTTLTIASGQKTSTGEVTVTAVNNSVDAPNKTVTVSGAASGGGVSSPADQTLTITDDDTKGIVLTPGSVTVTEASGTGNTKDYKVKLASQPTATVTVAVSSGDTDTATVNKASLSFTTTTWNTDQTVTVTGVDDSIDNTPDRSVNVAHAASGGDYGSVSRNLAVTVTESEGTSSLTVGDASVTEGDSGTASLTFTVTLSPAADNAVAVDWATSKETSDTATPGTDYTAASGTLRLAAGDTSKTVTVSVTGDMVDEPNETLTLTLSNATGSAAIGTAAATGTITDDDDAPSGITLVASPNAVTEIGGPKTVTVTASVNGSTRYAEAKTVAVTVGKSTDSATEGTDYTTVGSLSIEIAAGAASGTQNFTLTPTNDTVVEANETISVEGTSAGVTVTADQITITDDDTNTITKDIVLSKSAVTVTEASGAANTAEYTVKLATQPTAVVTVAVSSGDTSAATVNTASLSFTTTNWNQPQTVTVTGVDDDLDNMPDRTATVSHSASGGDYDSVSKDLTVTVTDDEASASISVYDTSVMEGDTGTADLMFRVVLSPAMDQEMTVEWTTEDGTATAGTDYNEGRGTLTFAAGDTVEMVTVQVMGDQVDESNESVMLMLRGSSNGMNIADGEAVGTIMDDDELGQSELIDVPLWISRFGRTVTDQSLDMISARLKRTSAPGGQVTIAGQRIRQWSGSDGALHSYEYSASDSGSLYERDHLPGSRSTAAAGTGTVRSVGADLHHDRPAVRYRRLSERVLLTGSSMSLTAEAESFGGLSTGLWGQGAIGEFDGRSGEITVNGKVGSGFFGIDFATSEKVMGLAVGYSRGKGGYRDAGCEGQRCDGDITASLTGVYPYAGLRLSERLSAWVAAGHAEGDLEFKFVSDDSVLKTDLQYKMAAAGLRGEILSSDADGASAAWKTDVRFTRISSDAASSESGSLKASVAKVWLARMGIEAAKSYQIGENGVVVTPSAQISLRFEGGDAETGHGAEAQIGLNIADRGRGLSVDAEVRGLAVHKAEGFREWNARAALAWDPDSSSAKGISMSLDHAWGGSAFAGSVEDSLIWQNRAADLAARGNNGSRGSADSKRIRFAMGYGMPVFGSRYIGTPNLGIEMSDDGKRDYHIGWHMTAAGRDESGFLLTADITRKQSVAGTDPEYGFMLRFGFRF